MSPETLNPPEEESLINETSYEGEQSPEFDKLLESKEHSSAPRKGVSELSKDKVLVSGWHVPCHSIIFRTEEGQSQIFHIQPDKLGSSLLTHKQTEALQFLAEQNTKAIAAKGERGWFDKAAKEELKRSKIEPERVISVETSNWWRLLYDPETNEIWIDIKDKKLLRKYRGF